MFKKDEGKIDNSNSVAYSVKNIILLYISIL